MTETWPWILETNSREVLSLWRRWAHRQGFLWHVSKDDQRDPLYIGELIGRVDEN